MYFTYLFPMTSHLYFLVRRIKPEKSLSDPTPQIVFSSPNKEAVQDCLTRTVQDERLSKSYMTYSIESHPVNTTSADLDRQYKLLQKRRNKEHDLKRPNPSKEPEGEQYDWDP